MAVLPSQSLPKGENTPTVRINKPIPRRKAAAPSQRAASFTHILKNQNAMRAHNLLRLDALRRLNRMELGLNKEIGLQEKIDNLPEIIDALAGEQDCESLIQKLTEINSILESNPPIHEIMAYAAASNNNSKIQSSPVIKRPKISPATNETDEITLELAARPRPVSQETVSLRRPAAAKQEAGVIALRFQANNTTEDVIQVSDSDIVSTTLLNVVDRRILNLINKSPKTVKVLAKFLAEHEGVDEIEITPEYLRENIENIHVALSIAIGGRNSRLRRIMAFTRAVFDLLNNSNLEHSNPSEGILDNTRIDRPLFSGDVEDLTDLEQELSFAYREMAVREVEDLWVNSAERPVVETLLSSFGVDYIIVSNSYKVSEYLLENSHNLMAILSNRRDDLARDLYAGSFMRRLSEIRVRYNAMVLEDAREVNRREDLTTEMIVYARWLEGAQLKALMKQRQEAIDRIEDLLRNSSQYQALRDFLWIGMGVREQIVDNSLRLAEYLFENIRAISERLLKLQKEDSELVNFLLGSEGVISQIIYVEHDFQGQTRLNNIGRQAA